MKKNEEEVWRKDNRREATTLYGATQPVSVTHTIKYAGMSLIDSNFIITFSMMTGIWNENECPALRYT